MKDWFIVTDESGEPVGFVRGEMRAKQVADHGDDYHLAIGIEGAVELTSKDWSALIAWGNREPLEGSEWLPPIRGIRPKDRVLLFVCKAKEEP